MKETNELNCYFFRDEKVTKKSPEPTVSGVPSSLKEVLQRPTAHGSEHKGNSDALRAAYAVLGPPGRERKK